MFEMLMAPVGYAILNLLLIEQKCDVVVRAPTIWVEIFWVCLQFLCVILLCLIFFVSSSLVCVCLHDSCRHVSRLSSLACMVFKLSHFNHQ